MCFASSTLRRWDVKHVSDPELKRLTPYVCMIGFADHAWLTDAMVDNTGANFGDGFTQQEFESGQSATHYKSKWRNIWIREVLGAKHVSNPAQRSFNPIYIYDCLFRGGRVRVKHAALQGARACQAHCTPPLHLCTFAPLMFRRFHLHFLFYGAVSVPRCALL